MSLIKFFLLGSIFFVQSFAAEAQFSIIEGYIISDEGKAVSDAHVYLSSSSWDITDSNGHFYIQTELAGSTEIKVSRVGFKSSTVSLDLTRGETAFIEVSIEEKIYEESPVVVTATRTLKELEDVSVPLTVIGEQEISMSGNLRLSDVLDEQLGLNIVSDHGTGIQVQGFDPEYTLILIDNQPVIGRTAGTLDLTRLAVGNIKQIEMVKGPSSALWGSDALAGVINIITEKGSKPFSWDVNARYGDYNTADLSSNLSVKKDRFKGRFFSNVNRSDGYDLDPNSVAPTIPEYQNITLSGGAEYRFNSSLNVGISARYYREDQTYDDQINDNNALRDIDGTEFQEDYNISPEITLNIGTRQLFEVNAFLSAFNSKSSALYSDNNSVYFEDDFEQTFNKYELKSSTFWSDDHTTVMGAGMNREALTAEIYAEVPYFDSYFTFGQHEWQVVDDFSLTGGFRFDAHSEYSSQFSPKFSGLYKPNEFVHIRASLGGGFKAPDFRQLFLNFTNPIAGYSVFGSSTVAEGIARLQEEGQIEELYFNPAQSEEIEAEHSFAYNAGIELFPTDGFQIRLNLFRNNVRDLIETQRIALKTNGQSVFSYINLNRIYTQGVEIEARYQPEFIRGFRVSAGYQLLDAKRQVTRSFDDVVNGEIISRTESDFVPMFNRSRHNGNLKFFYTYKPMGIEASLRFRYRSRFGFADLNGNNEIDENEYAFEANSFEDALNKTIINASVAKTFYTRYKLQVGVDNIMNYQNALFLPSNPGLTFYTQLNIELF